MSEYYNVVPWFNSEEWLSVYDKIYISQNKEEAHNLLLVWKARCPSLPSGIESTLTLLEVVIQDEKTSDASNDQLLRLAYSSGIMRFVNHMLDTETARGTSLYQAARIMGVPDWIIDLRHDTAHNSKLPSLELLREAASIGFGWLQTNYWDKHKECIEDFKTGEKDLVVTPEDNKIGLMMNFCLSLSFCAHSKCHLKNLSEIPDPSMRESIVNDARDLFGDYVDFSNLKTVSLTYLINVLNAHSKSLLKGKDAISYAVKALLGEDSFFLSRDLLDLLSNSEFYFKKKLNASYVQYFEVLLTFLHTNDILLDFILELIQMTNNSEDNNYKNQLSALWVSEILKSLKRIKQFIDRTERISSSEMKSKKRNELKLLYHHWFPNDKSKSLLLDLQKPVPPQLTNIKFLQPIISNYNPYLRFFIQDLLALVEPTLPYTVSNNICRLVELMSHPYKFPMSSSKIYTVEDIHETDEHVTNCNISIEEYSEPMDTACTVGNSTTQTDKTYGIFKLASLTSGWAECPIGMVPNN